MVKTWNSKRRLGIMLMVLAALVGGITANGYADPLGPQVTGPAVVGTLTFVQTDSSVTVLFDVKCRGNVATFSVPFSGSLPTTAANLEGVLLPGVGISACPGKNDQPVPSDNLIVKAVIPSKFMNTGTLVTADVVLLFVITP